MMYQNKFVAVVKSQEGKILREDGDVVYIPFGEEYSLQFKNLNSTKAVVSVEIDGQDVLNNRQLIVGPKESVNLERFIESLDTGNKFKFIKKTKEIQEHRGDRIDDGFIRITFQYEKPQQFSYFNTTFYSKKSTSPSDAIGKFYGSENTSTSSNSVLRSRGLSDTTMSANSMDNCATLDWMGTSSVDNSIVPKDLSLPQDDEGITVKGSKSTQSFRVGSVGALESEKHVLILRLKGVNNVGEEVSKPLTVKTKLECPTCGKSSDSTNKFCGNCGTALF